MVNGLLSLLGDESSYVRSSVAEALVRLGSADSSEVVAVLFSLVEAEEPSLRYRPAEVLGKLAKNSDIIMPKVLQWLEQRLDEYVTVEEIDCLWSIVVE